MQQIQYVLFDWAGTLTPWHQIDPADSWVAAVGAGEAAVRLSRAEDSVWIRCRDEHRSGTLAEVERLAGVTLTPEQYDAFFGWWDEHTVTDPLVPPLFAELAERGMKVGVLSNTLWPRARHEEIFRRDGVLDLIDGAVYSSEIEWTKPHPGAFRAALAAVGGRDPASAVFVGDRLFDDIHGAKSAGMRAVLVPHSVIPAWQTTGIEGSPDAVVDSLADLLGHLDGWLAEVAAAPERPGSDHSGSDHPGSDHPGSDHPAPEHPPGEHPGPGRPPGEHPPAAETGADEVQPAPGHEHEPAAGTGATPSPHRWWSGS